MISISLILFYSSALSFILPNLPLYDITLIFYNNHPHCSLIQTYNVSAGRIKDIFPETCFMKLEP